MSNKSKDFLALQDEWDRKLRAEGFKDIEDRHSPCGNLVKWDSFYFQARYTEDTFKAKADYFSRASDVLLTYKFSCSLEKAVWDCHAQGLSLREIVRKLRKKNNALNKDKVALFIRKIKKDVWGHE